VSDALSSDVDSGCNDSDDRPFESADERRRRSAVPAAAWVAIVGGALVLLAAGVVVATNWDALGRSIRFGGLLLVTGAIVAIAERLRRTAPTTAGIIAHVGAFLAAPIGIAAMSLFGSTWPTCLVVGGAIALAATEIQARRWKCTTFLVGQVAAAAIAAIGVAALTGTTAGIVAGVAAAALLAMGAERRAVGVATLAVLSPALTALADVGIGAGTLERAGLIGERLGWSGPVVGMIAATILGIVAKHRHSNGLMLMAATAPLLGLVTGLAAVDSSGAAWLSVPALAIIAIELGWWMLPTDRFHRPIAAAINGATGALAVVACAAPALAATALLEGDHPWALPASLTAIAMMLATLRLRAADHALGVLTTAASAASIIAGLIALDTPSALVAAIAVTSVALAAFLSRSLHPVAVYLPAFWALVAIVEVQPGESVGRFVVAAVLLAALLTVVVATRARLAAANHWIGWVEMFVVTSAAAVAATEFVPGERPAIALAVASVGAVAIMLADRRLMVWGLATVGTIGVITFDAAAGSGVVSPWYWTGWAVASGASALAWWVVRNRLTSYAGAAAAVIAAATSMAALSISAEQFIGLTMTTVAVLTGLAFTLQRRSVLDAAAVAAGCVLLMSTTFDVDPAWISAIYVVLGLQITSYGFIARQPLLGLGGAGVTTVAAASWWFTSGLNGWFVDLVEPTGITVGDLWMAATASAALIAGLTARRTLAVSSWLAYSASIAIAGVWLTSVQLERDTVWALPLALTIGIAAVALGAWHRLGAPLLGGTVLTAVTVLVASATDWRAIPPWAWLALGGSMLLGVAVVIERAGKPGSAGVRELVERWS
jgi:hypothetical protein